MLFKNLQQGNKVNKQRDEIQHADYLPPERGENNTSDVASSSIFLFSLNFLSPLDVFQHLCLWICKAAGVRFTCRQVPVQQAQSILGFCIFFFHFLWRIIIHAYESFHNGGADKPGVAFRDFNTSGQREFYSCFMPNFSCHFLDFLSWQRRLKAGGSGPELHWPLSLALPTLKHLLL